MQFINLLLTKTHDLEIASNDLDKKNSDEEDLIFLSNQIREQIVYKYV